jgi:hypothetical protein
MKICILCKKETTGSIGAAGIHWPNICQTCKDKEDKALLFNITAQAKVFEMVTKEAI